MRAANHLFQCLTLVGIFSTACAKKDNKENELEKITTVVASYGELPACSPEAVAQVFWVEDQEKLYVCNGKTFAEIKGEQGDKGDKGDAGSIGPAGSPANSAVWLFDADGKTIGVMVDATMGLVLFTNGGLAKINLSNGEYNYPIGIAADGSLVAGTGNSLQCYYSEAGCAGTCYQLKGNVVKPLKGAVYKTGSSYFVASGAEELVPNVVFKSNDDAAGGCNAIANVPLDAFPITTIYAFPEGISLPLKTPLSFGFKTEE